MHRRESKRKQGTNKFSGFRRSYVDFIARHDHDNRRHQVEEGPMWHESRVKHPRSRIEIQDRRRVIKRAWLNQRRGCPKMSSARRRRIDGLSRWALFRVAAHRGRRITTRSRLTDNDGSHACARAAGRIDLKIGRTYMACCICTQGMRGKSVDFFNKIVRPFAPNIRYLVTEFNIRLSLEGNPHLTNRYAMEFALKLADVMSRPEIEALYTHSVPDHSVLYWSNGRRYATVVGGRDDKLTVMRCPRLASDPTGKVYEFYSRLAWNGEVLGYRGGGNQSYWAVKQGDGRVVTTLINDTGKPAKKKVNIAGRQMSLNAPAHSIVCFDQAGQAIEQLSMPY